MSLISIDFPSAIPRTVERDIVAVNVGILDGRQPP
jgi:hypothetical protein